MVSNHNPTFIHELKLLINPEQLGILDTRLDIARQIYNACLGEALNRLKLMRDSKHYQQALKQPKTTHNSKGKLVANPKRKALFKQAREEYFFSEYAIHKYLTTIYSNTWLTAHVDSLTAQKLATRAFKAVEQYAYQKRGRPRFQGKHRFSSLEGKNNASGIRFVDGKIIWSVKNGHKLTLNPEYDLKDSSGLEAYALNCRTKYVRLVRRTLKGHSVWYAQLVQEGTPYIKEKNQIGQGIVGLDIGPSTIAIVGDSQAKLQSFCSDVEDYRQGIARSQKQLARSLRAMNPDNFEENSFKTNANGRILKKKGKVKKGPKTWVRSKRYHKLQVQVKEQQRKMAANRKCAHGQLVNELLRQGETIQTEKLSYKSFQKNFGRSVGFRAPGLFLEKLRRKAESAGGEVIEFNTRSTALSQMCHCGHKQKKSLKERWHHCDVCGAVAQRDLYSAFLARYVRENRLDTPQASKAWSGAGILLGQAVSNLDETTRGEARLASFGLGQRQSCLSAKEKSMQNEALDVVACSKDQARAKESFVSCS